MDLSEALNIFMRDFGGHGGFESLFGGGRREDTRRGQDIRVTVKLALSEVATGAKKTVKLKTLERCDHLRRHRRRAGTQPATCTTCGGSGEVRRAARSMFGQFVSVSPCPTCAGEGTSSSRSLRGLPRRGRVKGERTVTVDIPAGVSSQQLHHASGPGCRRSAQRSAAATCWSCSTSSRTSGSSATATI